MKISDARRMLDAARAKAAEIGKPVSMAVVDGSGSLILIERLDGAAPSTALAAEGKAAASALTGRDSGGLTRMAGTRSR